MFVIWFLAGLIPFVNFGRIAPIPSFWPQWCSAVLFLIIIAHGVKVRSHGMKIVVSNISYFDVSFLIIFIALGAQSLSGHVYSQAAAFMALGALFLAFWLRKTITVLSLMRVEAGIEWWLRGVLSALVIHAFAVVMGYFGKEFVYGSIFATDRPLRALGAFGQSNHLGVFSVLSIACIQYLFCRGKLSEKLAWIFFLSATWLCAVSFSRAALCVWLFSIVGAFVWFRNAFIEKNITLAHWRFFCITVIVFLIVQSISFWWPLADFFTGDHNAHSAIGTGRNFSSASRWEQVRDAIQLIKMHPFSGVGFEGFAGARFFELSGSLMETQVSVPHNLLLQLAVEFGIFGLLAGLVLSAWLIRATSNVFFKSSSFSLLSLLGAQWVIGLYVYSMFEFPLLYCYFVFPFFMMVGVLACGRVSIVAASVSPRSFWGRAKCGMVILGFLVLGMLALDYHRLYSFVHALKRNQSESFSSSIRDLAEIQSSSAFQFYANFIWLQVVELNDLFVHEKIQIASFVVRGFPQYNTISRYVAYLVLDHQEENAAQILNNLAVRNPDVFRLTIKDLKEISSGPRISGELKAFSESY